VAGPLQLQSSRVAALVAQAEAGGQPPVQKQQEQQEQQQQQQAVALQAVALQQLWSWHSAGLQQLQSALLPGRLPALLSWLPLPERAALRPLLLCCRLRPSSLQGRAGGGAEAPWE
jgi:hypothetical protein